MERKIFTIEDLMGAVAICNANPYKVDCDDIAVEILYDIDVLGVSEITDCEKRKEALAKLNLPVDSKRIVYITGVLIFSPIN